MGTYIIRDAYEKIQQVKKEQEQQVRQSHQKSHSADRGYSDQGRQGSEKKGNSG